MDPLKQFQGRTRNGLALLFLLVLIAGCSPGQSQVTPEPTCMTKECFIASANDCKAVQMTFSEEAGNFTYAVSSDCLFTKTLTTPNPQETQDMKNLLKGKSLSCTYEKGNFDERWANYLIFGTEYCEGELKEILGQLILFS